MVGVIGFGFVDVVMMIDIVVVVVVGHVVVASAGIVVVSVVVGAVVVVDAGEGVVGMYEVWWRGTGDDQRGVVVVVVDVEDIVAVVDIVVAAVVVGIVVVAFAAVEVAEHYERCWIAVGSVVGHSAGTVAVTTIAVVPITVVADRNTAAVVDVGPGWD